MAETKEGREKRRGEKETRREGAEKGGRKEKEEKTKKEKNNESKEGSRRIGDLGWERGSKKVWRKDQEISSSKVLEVDTYLWKESEWENTNKEGMKLCNRNERRVCAEQREDISIVKRKERKDMRVH